MFLVVLIADIVRKGLPAFTQHSLLLDVAGAGRSRAAGQAGAIRVAIRGADYFPLYARCAQGAPSRASRAAAAERTLTRLLSTGAADALRDRLSSPTRA